MYYDIDGNEITQAEWSALFKTDERMVLKTQIGASSTVVSTVWLGLAHGEEDGKPLIFETCIFGGNGDSEVTERYTSLNDALVGHYRNVDRFFEMYMKAREMKKTRVKKLPARTADATDIVDAEFETVD